MLLVTSNQNRQLRLRVQLFIYPKKIDVKKYSEVKTAKVYKNYEQTIRIKFR